jgi:hypothetical protein
MSWNFVIYKTGKTSQQGVPLGNLDRVTDALNGSFIDLEWESATSAVLPVEGGFRLSLTMQHRTVQDVYIDGGFNHLRQFAGLCKLEGWRMADAHERGDVDLGDPQKWYNERSAHATSHRAVRRPTSTAHGERLTRRITTWVILLLVLCGLGALAFYLWRLLGK